MPPIITPLEDHAFTLDSSGVAGFFGGEEAISAMATVHIYEGRKWLGWYNFPGSYTVAKKYGRLARARVWSALFPGVTVDPTTLFGLSGTGGPEFTASRSGTKISDTGHIGKLFLKKCQSLQLVEVPGRKTAPLCVTIANLANTPEFSFKASNPRSWHHTLTALVPILSSVAACVLCALCEDWFCFSMILLGILSGGISCFVIGSGTLIFSHPKPARGSPQGDGMLSTGQEFVIVLGEESAVNSITRGSFTLKFNGEPEYRAIGLSAALLTAQFLLQLLLIPQGTLFGQVMFLASLAVSWAYNCYLSSLDRDTIQANILTKKVLKHPEMKRYQLGTRTSAVVFATLALRPPEPIEMLDRLLPDTATWRQWKTVVVGRLASGLPLSRFGPGDYGAISGDDAGLLGTLFSDAQEAYEGYHKYFSNRVVEDEKLQPSVDGFGYETR